MKNKIKNHFTGNYLSFYSEFLAQIRKAGAEEYKAICPFHEDTNPSLAFNNQTGLFKCHGCSAGGNIFTFYAGITDLDKKRDFKKIMRGIAEKFGIQCENKKQQIVAKYIYTDLSGKPLHRTVRVEP
jgi:DNA primase